MSATKLCYNATLQRAGGMVSISDRESQVPTRHVEECVDEHDFPAIVAKMRAALNDPKWRPVQVKVFFSVRGFNWLFREL